MEAIERSLESRKADFDMTHSRGMAQDTQCQSWVIPRMISSMSISQLKKSLSVGVCIRCETIWRSHSNTRWYRMQSWSIGRDPTRMPKASRPIHYRVSTMVKHTFRKKLTSGGRKRMSTIEGLGTGRRQKRRTRSYSRLSIGCTERTKGEMWQRDRLMLLQKQNLASMSRIRPSPGGWEKPGDHGRRLRSLCHCRRRTRNGGSRLQSVTGESRNASGLGSS